MKYTFKNLGKAFAPRFMSKALQTFDRAMLVVVAGAWTAAILMLLFALYTVSASVKEKRDLVAAEAGEPVVPKVATKIPDVAELKPIVDRLQKNFADISLSLNADRSLTVSANDGGKFRLWLTSLSYIDTLSPQYRWSMKEFCVGMKCGATTPMRAVLTAEKINFTLPDPVSADASH